MLSRAFWSVVAVCAFLPGEGRAQPSIGIDMALNSSAPETIW